MKIKIYLFLLLCIIISCKKEKVGEIIINQQPNLVVPELTFPQNDQLFINSITVTFKWNAVPSAKKYQLLVSSDSSFQNIVKDFILNNDAGLPSLYLQYTYAEPNSSIIRSTLYWKVKAIDSAGNSTDYSKFYRVKCVTNLDVSPVITNTANDLVIVDPYTYIPTITWAKDPSVVSYEIFGTYSDNFVDKTNDQNFNFNVTGKSDIKMTVQTDNFYKFYIYNLWWNDTLQFVVREKFTDGTYSKWSLTNVIIKDPQLNLYTGEYRVIMKYDGDKTLHQEILNISKYSETDITLSIPSKGINLGNYYSNYFYGINYPNRLGEFTNSKTNPYLWIYNLYFKLSNGKMTIKGRGEYFEIISGVKL